jgi:hypothetical protein
MTAAPILRDERTVAVENASYRWSYLLLSFGLLGATAWRAFGRGEAAWDLLALVIAAGLVNTLYQGRQRVLHRAWAMASAATALIAVLIAVALVLLRSR